jgi:membrane associated rhomboid family serine protease/antitoxin component YwqK of YwqJK toxin-antitoxin module
MQRFREIPATLSLIIINVFVFIVSYIAIDSFSEPQWSLGLLDYGALFNPYALDDQWYRIFTHMFLHGHLLHLALNMYGLFVVGSEVESLVGTKKLLMVYFVSGIAAALTTLYFNLFSFGVGASGAIFGLFGFMLIVSIFISRKEKQSLAPILINFLVFVGINLLMAKAMHADNAAHFGGLLAGMLIGLFSFITGSSFSKIRIEYLMAVLLVVVYFMLPRYQVSYFKFFQKVLDVEAATTSLPDKNLSDKGYIDRFKTNVLSWDSVRMMLDAQTYLPPELSQDTFKLRRYINLRKAENNFRRMMVERESYIFMDSISDVQDSMKFFFNLDHSLSYHLPPATATEELVPEHKMIQVWYDSNWVEIPSEPASYYRIGYRDSVGRWHGIVRDYYATGDVQMKGGYKDGKRDGIFIYYSDHKTYLLAGRYVNDRRVGKWETYHENGRLASEEYYASRYTLVNLWDSLGQQQVTDGYGKETRRYPNGRIAMEGEYIDGLKQGYWYGRHPDGTLYYEENYHKGRLVSGRSRNLKGETFYYDESSQFPLPEGGYEKLYVYLATQAKRENTLVKGTVRLSFRVTANKIITDLTVEKSLTPILDTRAKEFLLGGPSWIPAKLHGQEAVDGTYIVNVFFGTDTLVE